MKTIYIVIYENKISKNRFVSSVNCETFAEAIKFANNHIETATPVNIIPIEIDTTK